MKQIEKNELIEGRIYSSKSSWRDSTELFIWKCDKNGKLFYSYRLWSKDKVSGAFGLNSVHNWDNIFEATPEEKHWLEVCIAANSFISYNEAMKTFIPEYVECTENCKFSAYILGKIYKVSNTGMIEDPQGGALWRYNQYRFKPSTKEAYDAQFVIKEPEFVLPENWYIIVKNRNEEINYYKKYFNPIWTYYTGFIYGVKNSKITNGQKCGTEITFEQFKKYVLKEQLEEPKDKVLEKEGIDLNIGKIIRVESSEGAIYQLGDKITVFTKDSPNKGKPFTIQGFRWNKAKTNLCAITELHTPNGIGLDKIELYSEPIVKKLSLLEQAKLKYPIGTKFKVAHLPNMILTVKNHENYYFQTDQIINLNVEENINGCTGGSVYYKGQWAEIVEDFKLPETWWITIENERQLEISKQYFSQYFTTAFKTIQLVNNIGFVKPANWTSNTYMLNLTLETKQTNPQITFEQFEQYVLHNGFKVGDIINNGNWIIIDLQYINNQSVAFYKYTGSNNTNAQCRILTKNIVR